VVAYSPSSLKVKNAAHTNVFRLTCGKTLYLTGQRVPPADPLTRNVNIQQRGVLLLPDWALADFILFFDNTFDFYG